MKRFGILYHSLVSLYVLTALSVNSQTTFFQKKQPPEYIKSIVFLNPKTQNSHPVIYLGDSFIFSFDDLEADSKRYRYEVVRYTHNWKKSVLFSSEFIDGISSGYIQNQKRSVQTLVEYDHYQVNIPNRKTQIRLSGNYGIRIYLKKKSKWLFEIRFMVAEPSTVNIQTIINRPQRSRLRQTHQNLEFKVLFSPKEDFQRNATRVHTYAFKNTDLESMTDDLKPSFISINETMFQQNDALAFEGGNEFRWFDTKDIRVSSLTTAKSVKYGDEYKTYLGIDEELFQKPYLDRDDINGEYVIRNVDALNERTNAINSDYSTVVFTLKSRLISWDFDIFIVGAFNNWQLSKENKMYYLNDRKLYELPLFIKQGYYNYQYVAKEKKTGKNLLLRY